MGLTIKREMKGTTAIFTLEGILDITTSHVIDSNLKDIDNIKELIFDFSELEFIDSTGIGSIINAIYLSQEKKFKIKFQGMNEFTNQVFETVGLFEILNALKGEVI